VKKEGGKNAPPGSLRRLWDEFTDPGPRGDTLVFLKNHADGIAPGCMGLLFMVVGILVAVLGGLAGRAEGKAFVAILFGVIFALAGFSVFVLGIKTLLRGGRGRM
jgi:hypothetical protein